MDYFIFGGIYMRANRNYKSGMDNDRTHSIYAL